MPALRAHLIRSPVLSQIKSQLDFRRHLAVLPLKLRSNAKFAVPADASHVSFIGRLSYKELRELYQTRDLISGAARRCLERDVSPCSLHSALCTVAPAAQA